MWCPPGRLGFIRFGMPLFWLFNYGGCMIEELTLLKDTYVVFDLETTGLYPNSGDQMIEIGAV